MGCCCWNFNQCLRRACSSQCEAMCVRVRATKRQRWMEKGERMRAGESHGPFYSA